MNDNVVSIDDAKPHMTVTGIDDTVHLIPEEFFLDVMKGNISLKELEDFDIIMPVIIAEWIKGLND